MARSYAELLGLEFEAERLVRVGVSRAEVSQRLGMLGEARVERDSEAPPTVRTAS